MEEKTGKPKQRPYTDLEKRSPHIAAASIVSGMLATPATTGHGRYGRSSYGRARYGRVQSRYDYAFYGYDSYH